MHAKGLRRQRRRRSPGQQPGTTSTFATVCMGISLSVLLKSYPGQLSSNPRRAKRTVVSSANRPAGVPTRPATPLCVALTRQSVVFPSFGFYNSKLKVVPKIFFGLVESKTRTYHRRVGAGRRTAVRRGGAGRGRAGLDADGSVCAGHNRPACPPGHRRQLFWTTLRKHEQRNPYVNRWINKTSGPAGLSAA